jgi:hypothetical protein
MQLNAQARCELEDADLAGFKNKDQFDFLWAMCIGNECFIGANDRAVEK